MVGRRGGPRPLGSWRVVGPSPTTQHATKDSFRVPASAQNEALPEILEFVTHLHCGLHVPAEGFCVNDEEQEPGLPWQTGCQALSLPVCRAGKHSRFLLPVIYTNNHSAGTPNGRVLDGVETLPTTFLVGSTEILESSNDPPKKPLAETSGGGVTWCVLV